MSRNKSTDNSRVNDSELFPKDKLQDYENEYKELLDEQFEKENASSLELKYSVKKQFERGLNKEMVINIISSIIIKPINI